MCGSITLERGWCHDSIIGMDYFLSFHYLLLLPLFPFHHLLCFTLGLPIVYSYVLTHSVR